MFLLIDGIPGESTDDNHKDWIEVVSYNYAISQPEGGAASSAGRTGAGQAQQQDCKIVKYLDKSSPKLALYSCSGKRIKEVTLELCRASGDKQKFMEYKMEDVLISSVNVSGSVAGSETIPVEEISLEYAKISWTYTEFDNTTGKPIGNVQSNWDLTAGKGG